MKWSFGESGLDSSPTEIAQTTDGYIWIGTWNGLYRFDGIRFTRWTPPVGEHLPDEYITHMLGASDGSLYLGTKAGFARLTGGHLYNYPEPARWAGPFVEDRRGTIWMGRQGDTAPKDDVCSVGMRHLKCFGERDGIGCNGITALASDRPGSLWIGSWQGICRWKQDGGAKNFAMPRSSLTGKQDVDVTALAIDAKGKVWGGVPDASPKLGLLAFDGEKWTSFVTPWFDGRQFFVRTLFADRHGSLWVGTDNKGLYRINDGRVDHFDVKDGLSSNSIRQIIEDRENNLWVVTQRGVDVFRDLPVLSFTSREGLTDDLVSGVNAEEPGTVWISTQSSILQYRDGRFLKVGPQLPKAGLGILFRDSKSQLWVELGQRLFCYKEGRFQAVMGLNGVKVGFVIAMAEDTDHQLWASVLVEQTRARALLRISGLKVVESIPSESIAGGQTLSALTPHPRGGLWIGGYQNGLFWFHDGHAEQIKPDGYEGPVNDIKAEPDGVWLMTKGQGVIWYKDGDGRSLTTKNGLPCDTVFDLLNDNAGSRWLHTECGLVRIQNAEIAHWLLDRNYRIKTTVFGPIDGVESEVTSSSSVAPDGRIWSTANDTALEVVDPKHLPWNPLPPPVNIERLIVDHVDSPLANHIVLSRSPRDIEIDYAGLSYVVPEKVRFRYRLEGHDKNWVDAGIRRQAFFNNLSPGSYTFHVIACNNDGIWNTKGAALSFFVPPSWYQTFWFRLLCVLLPVGAVYSLYIFRLRQRIATLKVRFDERLEERTRLARELHDTLLQTIQGSKMAADVAFENVHEPFAKTSLMRISNWLERATCEGRAALDSLRNSRMENSDLAGAFRQTFEDCSMNCNLRMSLSVTGKSKEIFLGAHEEIYRIGDEAIRNACFHSGGQRIDIELIYSHDLRLRIHDDGCGIDSETLRNGKPGHYGLTGMHERAERLGARLTLSSRQQGTEITLRVPGRAIYKAPSRNLRTRFLSLISRVKIR